MKISLKCKERNPNPYRLYEEWQTDVIERAKGITTTTRTAAGTAVVEIERLNMYVALYFPGRHQLCKNSIFQHIHPSIYPFVRPSIHSFAHSKGFKNQTSWLYYIWERGKKGVGVSRQYVSLGETLCETHSVGKNMSIFK